MYKLTIKTNKLIRENPTSSFVAAEWPNAFPRPTRSDANAAAVAAASARRRVGAQPKVVERGRCVDRVGHSEHVLGGG